MADRLNTIVYRGSLPNDTERFSTGLSFIPFDSLGFSLDPFGKQLRVGEANGFKLNDLFNIASLLITPVPTDPSIIGRIMHQAISNRQRFGFLILGAQAHYPSWNDSFYKFVSPQTSGERVVSEVLGLLKSVNSTIDRLERTDRRK